ncbi:glutathione hydrolase 1 proenzyme-like isoform X1 [Bombus pascuorum]|uniref:glutathione hydrolase 1 proenzyme-like isoform X1 n=2 Tax=Bombus pascuorum TaxID=65598 RepID=UPI00212BFD49|nr:glutathione hydrolase 1 proenzyme-like isoform X1 [Bombus pascuorum]
MIGLSRKRAVILGVSIAVVLTVILTIILVLLIAGTENKNLENESDTSHFGIYKKGAVSTNGQECAQIGAGMLMRGGSAVDAAIASLLCEGVASLHSMGLGGGFLMTIWDSTTKTANYLDARETAPSDAYEDMFQSNPNLALFGGLAIAVPGELLGYWEAHQKYGKLPWSDLFEPTISLCATGSRVTKYLASYLISKEPLIRAEKSLAEILINPITNSTWKVNDRIKRPRLAETLKLIASHGPHIFYNGTIADSLVEEIKTFNGIIKKEDLQKYRVRWMKPIKSTIGNLTMYTAPPPGSGAILTFIMNVLHGMVPHPDNRIMWQTIVETFKWAYAKRSELADPEFVDITSVLDNLTSTDYANSIRSKITINKTSNDPKYYGAVMTTPEDSGTSHVSVLAPDGSAVSVTSTINQVFGAMRRSRSTGIIFNDEMDDFSSPNITNGFDLPPSPANFIRPGKRPMSSMSPTIVVDKNGEVRLVIGAAGGTKITSAVAIAMVLNLWSGYNVKQAIDTLRIHHQLLPMTVQNEKGFSPDVLNYLWNIGHNVSTYSGIGSAITAISKQNGEIIASSDFRREGRTAGF